MYIDRLPHRFRSAESRGFDLRGGYVNRFVQYRTHIFSKSDLLYCFRALFPVICAVVNLYFKVVEVVGSSPVTPTIAEAA